MTNGWLAGDLDVPADYNYTRLQAVWASEDHTGSVVPALAWGPGAEVFAGSHVNWGLGRLPGRTLNWPTPGRAALSCR